MIGDRKGRSYTYKVLVVLLVMKKVLYGINDYCKKKMSNEEQGTGDEGKVAAAFKLCFYLFENGQFSMDNAQFKMIMSSLLPPYQDYVQQAAVIGHPETAARLHAKQYPCTVSKCICCIQFHKGI